MKVDEKHLIKSKLPLINKAYKAIITDDEDILFIGKNEYNNKIIGSLLDISQEERLLSYLHSIPNDNLYFDFLNSKISYSEYLRTVENLYVIKQNFDRSITRVYNIQYEDIVSDYLPIENTFCPKYYKEHSYDYTLNLRGKEADENKGDPSKVGMIQKRFAEFIEDRIKNLKGFNVAPKANLVPHTAGSFNINFELELHQKKYKTDLFITNTKLDSYINEMISYIVESFPRDKECFIKDNYEDSAKIKSLNKLFIDLYSQANIDAPEDVSTIVKEDILKAVSKIEKIVEDMGESYDRIEILNGKENYEVRLGLLDKTNVTQILNSLEEIDIEKNGLKEDEYYKDYQVYIYHLNTNTRVGNALIKNAENSNEMSKPKIKIMGDEMLEKTKYTKSLYLNQWIDVKAKAKKIGEKYKALEIEYENE
ncbi:MAG: hypothetical protein KGZ85_15650 [Ignavibacterium sp.]|nr:hypothetical protein [Ignavibacterium sp.]